MRALDEEKLLLYAFLFLLCCVAAPLIRKIPRNRGKNVVFHGIYVVAALVSVIFLPGFVKEEIFSPGGVLLLGTVAPVLESITAACSFGESDDEAWLQFWIASSFLNFSTEFIDDIRYNFPAGGQYWFELEFFFILWLMFPLTDGAAFLYDNLTKPYVAPTAKKIKTQCEGYIGAMMVLVNSSFMYFLWFAFMALPEEARRFLVVAAGTLYPIAASIVAATTNDEEEYGDTDTFWLTYWACFNVLFVCMDYLENFVGEIPGFYSLCLVATLYLFLPMFQGADVVFRRVLVPLTGHQHDLMLRDAFKVRITMEKSIPEAHRADILSKAASFFSKELKKKNKKE